MSVLTGFLVVVVLIGLWLMTTYNGLVRKRTLVEEGWSGIETQLKLRANLIPNLVETVKGYASHEETVFTDLSELRSKSIAGGSVGERSQTEGAIGMALGRLFAVAEAYPELKADENFRSLQDELSRVENDIQLARRYYNGTVRNLNIMVEQFPSVLVANWFEFIKAEFFEIENDEDRAVPQVSFE